MDQTHVQSFSKEYRADVTRSQKQYMKANTALFGLGSGTNMRDMQIDYEIGVDITLSQSRFERLLEDAESGREFRLMRSRHPGVLEAWDKYRMMMILAYRDEGRDPP